MTTLTLLDNITDELNPVSEPVRLTPHLGRNMFTVSIKMDEFIGRISIEASLVGEPDDNDWFRVKIQDLYKPDFANDVRHASLSGNINTNIIINDLSSDDWYAVSPGMVIQHGIHNTEWNIINGLDLKEVVPQSIESSIKELEKNSIVIPLANSNKFWGISRTVDNELLVYSSDKFSNFNPFSIYKIASYGRDRDGFEYLRYDDTSKLIGTVGFNFTGNYAWLRASIDENYSGVVSKILVLC